VLDFAVLPIGDNFTMGIDDAIRCCDFIRCTRVIGVHYNTFPYIAIDVEEAKNKFRDAGKELILPGIGETIEL
jgi:L-ascorbate metabolism protein UlaG (beta-lactamase superfamily)